MSRVNAKTRCLNYPKHFDGTVDISKILPE